MNFFRRFRDATICVALLAIPFFFLKTNLQDPGKANVVDKLVLGASAPIQFAATLIARGVSTVWEDYVYLVEVRRDNERLRYENARLQQDNERLIARGAENRRLRALLQLREELGGEMLSAQVISKYMPAFRVLRISIDRGERDRVRPGMPVVTPEGLVGQVRRVWGRYADVLLTVDRDSAVAVVIQRNGAHGMLKGLGESDGYGCRFQYVMRANEVRVGDLVHTSGYGQKFPGNILVGRVTNVIKRDFGLYQDVEVAPSVDFSRLEEVLIMMQGSRQSALEDPREDGEGAGARREER